MKSRTCSSFSVLTKESIQNLKNRHQVDTIRYTSVYIHIGNFESSTDACQVIGNKAGFDSNNHFRNFESTDNFKRLYFLISKALNNGEKVTYEIIDRD